MDSEAQGAVVKEMWKGKATIAEVARRHDLTPSEVEGWVDEVTRHLERGFRTRPKEVCEQYEADLKEPREALGEAQLQIRALKKLERLVGSDEIS